MELACTAGQGGTAGAAGSGPARGAGGTNCSCLSPCQAAHVLPETQPLTDPAGIHKSRGFRPSHEGRQPRDGERGDIPAPSRAAEGLSHFQGTTPGISHPGWLWEPGPGHGMGLGKQEEHQGRAILGAQPCPQGPADRPAATAGFSRTRRGKGKGKGAIYSPRPKMERLEPNWAQNTHRDWVNRDWANQIPPGHVL